MKISIDGWDAGIKFVAGHFLPSIEKCSRLHGHNYALKIVLEGEPGSDGIILDFIKLKEAANKLIDRIDHRMLLPETGKSMVIRKSGDSYSVRFNGKKYIFPASDVVMLPMENVSAEELSAYFAEEFARSGIFGANVKSISVGVSEGRGQQAWTERHLI
jgi:6-pyruvoyltetrahydropterin/6-carboxytetrahydropterin synthase